MTNDFQPPADGARIGDLSAAERNREPIFDVLMPLFSSARRVLEVGSGDATHARHARLRCPHLHWQTSEVPEHLPRLMQAVSAGSTDDLALPITLDVRDTWPDTRWDAIYGANIAHIMTMDAVHALFRGAGEHLQPLGLLCLYGPFIEPGKPLGDGNRRFDAALQKRGTGLRSLTHLDALATANQLRRVDCHTMPADNRLLVWQRSAA